MGMNPAIKPVDAPRACGPGRPKDMGKRMAILEAAKQLFVQHGYEGTSMDAVAAAAGVSKLTVYSHFGDKDRLFREAIRARCQALIPDALFQNSGDGIRAALLQIAQAHADVMVSAEAIGTWRAIVSDCREGNPRLGLLLWEEGPGRGHALMEQFLNAAVAAGELDIPDVPRAAVQFLALLKGDMHLKRLFGCEGDCIETIEREVRANVLAAVEMFLRAYAPR